jgi:quercetin dioxygenase-like cupin family protein
VKGRKGCAQPADARVQEIGKRALSGPFAGMEASLVEVRHPPGGRSAEHRHQGFIVGYVLEGQIRFAINHETPCSRKRPHTFGNRSVEIFFGL